ncbi:MAG: hypothetical protein ACYCPQ_04745 [Elusimicrobiota bacterium]
MLSMILALAATAVSPVKIAQVRTCQWPHRCESQIVAQVRTCQWPHRCENATNALAPILPITGPCRAGHVCAAS